MVDYITINLDQNELKMRWQEPYVTEGLNRKFVVLGKGIARGFNPVVNGRIVELHVDAVASDSVGVVETANHYSVTVYKTSRVDIDFTDLGDGNYWIVLEVNYVIGSDTTGTIKVVNIPASYHVKVCKVTKTGTTLTVSVAPTDRDYFLLRSDLTPEPIASSGNPGISSALARSDHTHEGVHRIIAGSNIVISPADGKGDVTISSTGGGGVGGHTIQDEGTALPQRANLNFVGPGITASDDAANNATKVQVITTGSPRDIQAGDTAEEGIADELARRDHKHGVPVDEPIAVGAANAEGSATTLARSDHVHEGVHQIIAGTGIQVNPSSGLGDVTISTSEVPGSVVLFNTTGVLLYISQFVKDSVKLVTVIGAPGNTGRTLQARWLRVSAGGTTDIEGNTIPDGTIDIPGRGRPDVISLYKSPTWGLEEQNDGTIFIPPKVRALIVRVLHSAWNSPDSDNDGIIAFHVPKSGGGRYLAHTAFYATRDSPGLQNYNDTSDIIIQLGINADGSRSFLMRALGRTYNDVVILVTGCIL
jgi:hypothetical protein